MANAIEYAGPTRAWKKLDPHPVQRRLWYSRARFRAVWAGRGSGKTEIAKRYLTRMLAVPHGEDGGRYFYGAPTEAQAKRIAWEHLLKLTPASWIGDIRLGELTIVSKWGVSLTVLGLDAPQRIEGVQWNGGVLDESSDIKPGTFERSVLPALSWRRGWCWRIGACKRFGVGAQEFRKFCDTCLRRESPDVEGFTWPSTDILDPEAIAAARRIMTPKDFREQFMASWETAGGGVFYAFDRATHGSRRLVYRSDLPLVVGCDFNVDPMCWAIGHRYRDQMEWIDEIVLRNTNTPQALEVLAKRYADHKGGFEFYPDASGRARKTSSLESDIALILSHEFFRARGRNVYAPRANPMIRDRMADTNAMFKNAAGQVRMYVDPHCKKLIEDLEARSYEEGTSELDDSGDVGHISDAMSYAVTYLFPIRVPSQLEPPLVTILTA